VVVTYETIPVLVCDVGRGYQLRRRRARPGDKWYLDEVFIRINGTIRYLWRAVEGDIDDCLARAPALRASTGQTCGNGCIIERLNLRPGKAGRVLHRRE
jgi:hypothetical protein